MSVCFGTALSERPRDAEVLGAATSLAEAEAVAISGDANIPGAARIAAVVVH